jgi:putative flavoprotein involved in K+ transport
MRKKTMTEYIETVIVGGGQAGLAVSYYLTQKGLTNVVLEQAAQAGEAWRNHRWDSFTFITPNWMTQLPGAEYAGDEPDSFMPLKEIVAYFEDYIDRFKLPVRYNTHVTSVEVKEDAYIVQTNGPTYEASNVVMATGLYQRPRIPSFSTDFAANIEQLHSSEYRNPEALPAGAVLVVGSAQSGCQIAEDLYESGRKVYLCVSQPGRLPRRYRGKDITYWLVEIGFMDQPVDKLPSPKAKFGGSAHGSGTKGGHTINLHQFSRDGVALLGRIVDADGSQIKLAPDLKDSLAKIDQFEAQVVEAIDGFIEKKGLEIPEESLPQLRDGYELDEILSLDMKSAGISTVIWATGFRFDYSLVKLPVIDEDGYPIQKRGITKYPGLYFVGMPWLTSSRSGLLFGVGEDAAHISTDIASRSQPGG